MKPKRRYVTTGRRARNRQRQQGLDLDQEADRVFSPAEADPLHGLLVSERMAADLDVDAGWRIEVGPGGHHVALVYTSPGDYRTSVTLTRCGSPVAFLDALAALTAEARAGNLPHRVLGEGTDYLMSLLGAHMLGGRTLPPEHVRSIVRAKVPKDERKRIGKALEKWARRVARYGGCSLDQMTSNARTGKGKRR